MLTYSFGTAIGFNLVFIICGIIAIAAAKVKVLPWVMYAVGLVLTLVPLLGGRNIGGMTVIVSLIIAIVIPVMIRKRAPKAETTGSEKSVAVTAPATGTSKKYAIIAALLLIAYLVRELAGIWSIMFYAFNINYLIYIAFAVMAVMLLIRPRLASVGAGIYVVYLVINLIKYPSFTLTRIIPMIVLMAAFVLIIVAAYKPANAKQLGLIAGIGYYIVPLITSLLRGMFATTALTMIVRLLPAAALVLMGYALAAPGSAAKEDPELQALLRAGIISQAEYDEQVKKK